MGSAIRRSAQEHGAVGEDGRCFADSSMFPPCEGSASLARTQRAARVYADRVSRDIPDSVDARAAPPWRLGRTWLAGAVSLAVAWGCASTEPSRSPVIAPVPERVLRRGEVVPAFRVETFDGSVVDSRGLVGKQAFVLVFFATWCPVCRYKLPVVGRLAGEYSHEVSFLGVVLEPPEHRDRTVGYAARYGLSFPLIDGLRFGRFTRAYDPSHTVPVVIVVDRRGYPIEYQSGFSWRDARRLRAALNAARAAPRAATSTARERRP
jgi:thiol-disulfide isomerase/thioredoxin